MNSRYNRSNSAVYTANLEKPSDQRGVSLRGIVGIALTLLLPPLGLMFLWHQGVFRTRGRVLLTAVATLEMMGLFVLLTPHQELALQKPVPVAPVSVTAAPEGETVNALSNIEQLLYEQQLAKVVAQGGDESDLLTEQQRLEAVNAQNAEIYETIVYAVFRNATLYHKEKVCGTQTNGRELTVREAMSEGLGACPNCNPPMVTF